jgi:hypothetical protein
MYLLIHQVQEIHIHLSTKELVFISLWLQLTSWVLAKALEEVVWKPARVVVTLEHYLLGKKNV